MGNPKQKWTSEEEKALRAGVAKHGTGKWKNIQKDPEFNHLLVTRSNIDLKDKWRNLSVASGQGPRGKSKTPKAKAKAINTPATPLPTAQTSASIAPSSQDASTDVVMLDSSRPSPEGHNAAKSTRRKGKKIVSSTKSTERKGKEIVLPTQTRRNGKEIVAPTPTRMMTRSATTTPTKITRSNTTKTLTRVTPSRVTKSSGAAAKEIRKSTEKSTTLRKTLGVKRKLKVSKAFKQDLAAKLQPQGTDGKPQPQMTDGKLQPQIKVAASISSTLSRPAGRRK